MLDNKNKFKDAGICVGLDMDGVIFDHSFEKIRLASFFGWTLDRNQTPSEIIKKVLPQDVLLGVQTRLYGSADISSQLIDGVIETLDIFKARNIPFVLISRRKIPSVAIELLARNGLWGKYFTHENTAFVERPEDKNIAAEPFFVTHYLDDEIKVLNALSSVPRKFLFDSLGVFPKNELYMKVGSWKEFRNHIC